MDIKRWMTKRQRTLEITIFKMFHSSSRSPGKILINNNCIFHRKFIVKFTNRNIISVLDFRIKHVLSQSLGHFKNIKPYKIKFTMFFHKVP